MNARIRALLAHVADCEADLADAASADQAADARAGLHSLYHSLWLAGWKPENELETSR